MIIKDEDAIARLQSPMNLMNRLKSSSSRNSAMSLFGIGKREAATQKREEKLIEEVKVTFNPFSTVGSMKEESQTFLPPQLVSPLPVSSQVSPLSLAKPETLDSIIKNNDSQIKLGLAHDAALDILNQSVLLLSTKLDDVRADKLPAVITAASKVVESIRRERSEANKNSKDHEVHYHFYTPTQKSIADYGTIIDVNDAPVGVA